MSEGDGALPVAYEAMADRAPLKLPGDARIAVWVGLNIEDYDFAEPVPGVSGESASSPRNYGTFLYGLRVGLWRVVDLLAEHGIRPSVLLNSDICAKYPDIIARGREGHWVWIAHGRRNRIRQHDLEEAEERSYVEEVLGEIERATGARPRGWLGPGFTESPRTLEILAAAGVEYVCDWCIDDHPLPIPLRGASILAMPYTVDLNDVPLRDRVTGGEYAQMIRDAFDVLYEEGKTNPRVMSISLHPFVVGQPHRAKPLAEAFDHICRHPGVWLTTSDDIASWHQELQGEGTRRGERRN